MSEAQALITQLRETAAKLLEQAALLELAPKEAPPNWLPPREMVVEICDDLEDGEWSVRLVKTFRKDDAFPIIDSVGVSWRFARPLRNPLVLQFRPHVPGNPIPEGVTEAAAKAGGEVLVMLESGDVFADIARNLSWRKNPGNTDIIGWLPIGARW
jgi:hypothetical protein